MKSLSFAKSSILGFSSSSSIYSVGSGAIGVVVSSTVVVFSSGVVLPVPVVSSFVGSGSGSLGDSSAGVGVTGCFSG